MSEWQSIETAPKDGTAILLGEAGKQPVIGHWEIETGRTLISADNPYWEPFDNSRWDYEGEWLDDPTHWQPLPPPPTG